MVFLSIAQISFNVKVGQKAQDGLRKSFLGGESSEKCKKRSEKCIDISSKMWYNVTTI
jgi:hypothetical protein